MMQILDSLYLFGIIDQSISQILLYEYCKSRYRRGKLTTGRIRRRKLTLLGTKIL